MASPLLTDVLEQLDRLKVTAKAIDEATSQDAHEAYCTIFRDQANELEARYADLAASRG